MEKIVILFILISCGKGEPEYSCAEYYDPVNNTYTDEELDLIRYNYRCETVEE